MILVSVFSRLRPMARAVTNVSVILRVMPSSTS